MTFEEGAYEKFAEGQIYSLYIPFGEYKNGTFVEGSCEGYATLLIKIVPEYLTWKGPNAEVWYNDGNWHQSTKGELYIDPNGTNNADANGNDADLTAAYPEMVMRSGRCISLIGVAISLFCFLLLSVPGSPAAIGLESWVMLLVWVALGVIFYLQRASELRAIPEREMQFMLLGSSERPLLFGTKAD